EAYFDGNEVGAEDVIRLIMERRLFPVYFGSALKMKRNTADPADGGDVGVIRLLEGLDLYARMPAYGEEFGARVYKISRDETGSRLTWMKITGGRLKARTLLTLSRNGESGEEKADQIRSYSGEKYQSLAEAYAGQVCTVTGLTMTYAGQIIGAAGPGRAAGGAGDSAGTGADGLLQPVLSSRILLEPGMDQYLAYRNLLQIEEEEPMLHITYDEAKKEITAQMMGEMQRDVIRRIAYDRFHMLIDFGQPGIVYKETIKNTVEGVGHFEPLRHYAEVHLLLEPGEPGSGLIFSSRCSTDVLARNWQRLVLTHLGERRHRGVLTGSEITDMKITLIAGRAHEKHTEGGDFRQATYRAVRQGLMMAENILLEPWYDFKMEIPRDSLGRALTDLQQMGARLSAPDFTGENGETAMVEGAAPVSAMGDYSQVLKTYTRGEGRLTCTVRGYEPCHNTEEVMEERAYDPELDFANPTGSVFCSHGSGTLVPWNMVRDYMHVDTGWRPSLADGSYDLADGAFKVSFVKSGMSGGMNDFYNDMDTEEGYGRDTAGYRAGREKKDTRSFKEKARDYAAGEEELRAIFERTYGAVKPRVGEDSYAGSGSRRIRAGSGSGTGSGSGSGTGNGSGLSTGSGTSGTGSSGGSAAGGAAGQEAYSADQFYGRRGGRSGRAGKGPGPDQKVYLELQLYKGHERFNRWHIQHMVVEKH
ncbi:MAG: TetM/TetW/TetO/TetS family tetracycline resistance ribosomal protection protein, partial [Lachnospiraceae bacterium]|nr:TetM/TetW/TetO/TetS family tetracycline resistance ribosomal protection protein [Lachnospiraceae bacterium]